MDTDDLRAEINAVEQEIAGQSSSVTRKHRRNIPWVMIIAALLVFVVVEWSVHHRQKTGIDADLNHMMQQARHDVLDYLHRTGRMPSGINNPALKPYISLSILDAGGFRLEGHLGDVTQELESQ
jgi:hypothetical protein